MDHSDFFSLSHSDEATEADVLTKALGYKLACAISRGEHEMAAPLQLKVRRGGVDTILNTDGTMLTLCSLHFISFLREQGFTGWKTYGVHSTRNGEQSDTAYVGLVATGRSGNIDNSLSPKIQRQVRPGGQVYTFFVGRFFHLDTWDGSDVFMPSNTQHLLVTRRLMEAVQKANIKGCSFKPISEIEKLA